MYGRERGSKRTDLRLVDVFLIKRVNSRYRFICLDVKLTSRDNGGSLRKRAGGTLLFPYYRSLQDYEREYKAVYLLSPCQISLCL